MGERTGIAWCHHTQNFWIGCLAVSPACDRCYARTLVNGRMRGDFDVRRRTTPEYWRGPFRWARAAAAAGERRRVFTLSLGDLWDNQVPPEWRADALDVIRRTTPLDYMALTKRPQNILRMLGESARVAGATGRVELARWLDRWVAGEAPAHVWLGVTVEDQAEHDRRVPVLRAVPAALRFLSVEPMLGPIAFDLRGVSQAIFGGESGAGARPYDEAWPRDGLRQCRDAGVAFFHKQAGANRIGFRCSSGKGDVPEDWPPDLRVQEVPPSPAEVPRRAA